MLQTMRGGFNQFAFGIMYLQCDFHNPMCIMFHQRGFLNTLCTCIICFTSVASSIQNLFHYFSFPNPLCYVSLLWLSQPTMLCFTTTAFPTHYVMFHYYGFPNPLCYVSLLWLSQPTMLCFTTMAFTSHFVSPLSSTHFFLTLFFFSLPFHWTFHNRE